MSYSFSSSGKKDNGEGGIFFDKEEDKEQWEDDQKASCAIVIYVITDLFPVRHCLFVFILTFPIVSRFCSDLTDVGTR